MLSLIIIISTAASYAALIDTERRKKKGVPVVSESLKSEFLSWVAIFALVAGVAATAGVVLYAMIKFSFAKQGLLFP